MKQVRFAMIAICVLMYVALSSRAFAGSTGGLSGVLTDAANGKPLVHAKISVASPSAVATVYTDASGAFSFLSLAPDTYTVSAEIAGYDAISTSGVTVNADQIQRLTLRSAKTLTTIGTVRSRSAGVLVRPGTVTDTYSIDSTTQSKITGLGGGGSLNQGYSALAATPGVFVPAGQSGWSQTAGVTIRGGTHNQIGYEYDGVPVNVGVNGFSGTNLSTLGQQEIQVYSGSAPLNSEAQGLSGYVNQVVKTGTYPGFAIGQLGIGGPFYHKASFEIGGATKDRNFSYYLGTLGANQAFDVLDNYNGASYTSTYGSAYNVVSPCPGGATSLDYASCYNAVTPGGLGVGPGGFVKAPVNYLSPAYQQDRENVANLHFGIPHKDGTKDDVQLLYQTGGIASQSYSSASDLGVAPYPYPSGFVYTGALATTLPANYKALVTPYAFPGAKVGEMIPANLRDLQQNDQSIFKLQYQHNMGNAYVRAYGYSLYSNFLYDAPNGGSSPASNFLGNPPDYKLWTHTSGYSLEFADQLSSKDLLLAQLSYTHAPSVRDNSTTWATGSTRAFAVAVDSTNPNSGLCYTVAGGLGAPASCENGGGASTVTYGSALGLAGAAAPANLTGAKCGTGPCSYYVVDNGYMGADNTVVQNNVAASLSDQWKPTARVTIDAGLRFHDYGVRGADTGGGARDFWFNAFNEDYCVNANPGSTPMSKASLGLTLVTQPCSAADVKGGNQYVATTVSNGPADYNFVEYEPRIGVTYAAGGNDVFRASYGKYSQAPPTAYQQYDTHQQNLAAYLAPRFYKYGYTGSGHDIPPEESFNLDGSWEHNFKGTDVSFKATPYYRTTRNELTEFFIDPINQLTSALAVGSLRSSGVEFQLRKGSFDRNGLAALVSYTYTNARIKYYTLPGGGSIISPINNDIRTYNAYTSYCATHADARCGATSTSVKAARCFTPLGLPDPACGGGSIANPYWNAPVQNTLDPSGSYYPTDPVVATTGLGVNSYTVPHIATLVVNYRHNAFSLTPSVQFQAGQRYGAPEANAGIDPAGPGCTALAGATTANDPRYPYGSAGGAPYNALTCTVALNAIPDVFTNTFDGIGAFTSPSQLLGSLTASLDVTKNLTFSVTAANLFNQCFGGTKAEWTGIASPHVCSYVSGEISRGTAPTGNVYNPGAKFDPLGENPYYAYLGPYTMGVVNPSAPLEVFVNASLKL